MKTRTSMPTATLRSPSGRRSWLSITAMATVSVLSLGSFTMGAQAQDSWPNKPIRLVVPFTPGGVTDTSARVIADYLGKRLGQNVVVDNRPGASGNIGTAMVKNAAPDGYTLVLGFDGTMVINPHVFSKLPFDTLKDFTPIGKIGDATLILVSHPDTPVKTLADVIALSKSTPGGLSFGTSGTGGTPHIAGELLKIQSGAKLVHVPYKGGGQAMTDVVGGLFHWSTPQWRAHMGSSSPAGCGQWRCLARSVRRHCPMCRLLSKLEYLTLWSIRGLVCWPL